MNETDKKFIDVRQMTVPKGGGAYKGLDDEYKIDLFKGEGHLNIPINITPCRSYEPKLQLQYSASNGNDIFGLGFSLNLLSIYRKTKKNIPHYEDKKDEFVLSNEGSLVFKNTYQDNQGSEIYEYMLRNEKDFSKITYHRDSEHGTSIPNNSDDVIQDKSYWEIQDRNNTLFIFGKYDTEKRFNPHNHKVYSWLLSECIDEKGNKIKYIYDNNKHIRKIIYGNYYDGTKELWGFSVEFIYEADRIDCFSRYNSGYMQKTDVLCKKIQMIHHFKECSQIVKETSFSYESKNGISLLNKVSVTGYKTTENENLEALAMPDLCLSYTEFNPSAGSFHKMEIDGDLPFTLNRWGFTLIDLYGEGIPGLFYSDGITSLYCAPKGDYRYDKPRMINKMPIHKNIKTEKYLLTSLEANGQYDLVVQTPDISGYYEMQKGEFQGFQPFKSYSNVQFHSNKEITDLQGDKRNHILETDEDHITYYPSLKKNGTGNPVIKKLPAEFPHITENSPTSVVRFLDMFGDGLLHRVKIQNGSVSCWPNLGYGTFGDKIEMQNAPAFKGVLDAARLYFADIDGTGTTDFIYAYPDHVEIYFNQCGEYFREPLSILLPQPYAKGDRILFGDVPGTGTSCMIFCKMGYDPIHYCYDFANKTKPYMLETADYNTGVCVELEYMSSVQLYLKDRQNDIAWNIKAPFPIQLITNRKMIDACSDYIHETTYEYRDACYDFEENEFKGFGFIKQYEKEYALQRSYESEGTCTKYWYYVGVDYQHDFFTDDKERMEMEPHIFQVTDKNKGEKALYGHLIRQETYTGNNVIPLTAEEINYKVIQLIKPQEFIYGSFYVHNLQKLSYAYEKQADDPRVHHEFELEKDAYGNTLKTCTVHYKRRKETSCQQQQTLSIYFTADTYANTIDQARHTGVLLETKSYEIKGLAIEKYFTEAQLRTALESALSNIIPFGQEAKGQTSFAVLSEWKKLFYWDDTLSDVMPEGQVGLRLLLHHQEEAVFPQNFTGLHAKIAADILENDCGYECKEDYWWNCGLINSYYDESQFYLPWKEEHKKQNIMTGILYDSYCLMPVQIFQKVKENVRLELSGSIDYTVLDYNQIIDFNDNVVQALFNPLGQVIVHTAYGMTQGMWEGNGDIKDYQSIPPSFERVLQQPEEFLQKMSSYFFYDLRSFQERKQPLSVIQLTKESFESCPTPLKFDTQVTYYSGTGKILEERHKTPANDWSVSNKKYYSRNEKEIATYPSFHTSSPYYGDNTGLPPILKFYDGKDRLLKTYTPRKSVLQNDCRYIFSKTEYTPWEDIFYDENSCLKDTAYYQDFINHFPDNPTTAQTDEKEMLEKTLKFQNHIQRSLRNPLGHKIADVYDEAIDYTEFYHDCKGHLLSARDPRLKKINSFNILYQRDMQGNPVYTNSCDAGEKISLQNVFGKEAVCIEANGIQKKIKYDSLNRPTEIIAEGIGLVEKIEYGEALSDSKARNLNGQVHKHYDQSGVRVNHCFTAANLALEKSYQLCSDYRNSINWLNNIPMEAELFHEQFTYNALGSITRHLTPDNTQYTYEYNQLGQLNRIMRSAEGDQREHIRGITYNANGQKSGIVYGNNITTSYTYDEITGRLQNVKTVKDADGQKKPIQNLSYIYDLTGNISRVRDNLGKTCCNQNQIVEPIWDYQYDHRYQLIYSTGREMGRDKKDFQNIASYKESFSYDQSGNMIQMKHSSPFQSFTKEVSYYDESCRMKQIREQNEIKYQFEYDASGNMTGLPNVETMVWNWNNQLSGAIVTKREHEENDAEYYVYNSNGDRVRKVGKRKINDSLYEITENIYIGNYTIKKISSDTINFYRTSTRILHEKSPVCIDYFWQQDDKKRESKDALKRSTHYQLENNIHSVQGELNESGEIIHLEEYYSFGGTALFWSNKSEVLYKEYRYCNKECDSITGLYYYGARYYSTVLGRMISADAVEYSAEDDGHSYNLYLYCKNNPLRYIDPDGHCPNDNSKAIVPYDPEFAEAQMYRYRRNILLRVIGIITIVDGYLKARAVMMRTQLVSDWNNHQLTLARSKRYMPPMAVGAYSLRTGTITAKFSGQIDAIISPHLTQRLIGFGAVGTVRNQNTIGKCAEFKAANELLTQDQNAGLIEIRFTDAIRPLTGIVKQPCGNCRHVFVHFFQ